MNVLSLFDGISCAQLALQRTEIKFDTYFASEIDRFAISITQNNFPSTVQIGNVTDLKAEQFPRVDLLIGGSPCKDLSFANKEKKGLAGKQSSLFYEYVRLLQELKPKYFILENVVPIGDWKEVMDKHIGCVGTMINSSLVTPQSRKRVYWTNIPYEYPTQQEYKFEFEKNPDKKYYANDNILKNKERLEFALKSKSDLCGCLTEAIARNGSSKEYMRWLGWVHNKTGEIRKLTPIECERLQTIPDNYTANVSDYQRYKALGNCFTVDIVAHILKGMK